MKFIFKWLLRLFITGVLVSIAAIIVLLLSYNAILRDVMERSIRAQTSMDAEIGRVHLALTEPTLEIQNLKIYNTKEFGGTLFLDIPEIHVEYDRAALKHKQIHVTLMRFNLGEVDIVKNQAGQTNIFLGGLKVPPQKSGGGNPLANIKTQSGYDFTGIDVLNVSIGKVKFVDLKNQNNNREQVIGIENCIMKNVTQPADFAGLAADIAIHSNGFFESLLGNPGQDILKQLGF